MEKDWNETVERLLQQPYWVIDLLPGQEPPERAAQYFAIERYYLQEPRRSRLCQQFADVLLKLNCYHDMQVSQGHKWVKDPEPSTLQNWLTESLSNGHLCIVLDDGEAFYLTLYAPSPALLKLVETLATATGLFVWQPQENQ